MKNDGKNLRDVGSRTSLMYAALEGNDEKLKKLISDNVDINAQDDNGFTALHFASQEYRVSALKLLLQAGAKVDVPNKFGNTALSEAVFNSKGQSEIIKLLLEKGANRYFKNTNGISPLDLANNIANYNIKQFFD